MTVLLETVILRGVLEGGAWTQTQLLAMITQLIGASGNIQTPNVLLFTNDVTPNTQSALGDLDAPTWSGYAEVVGGWGDPNRTGDNGAEVASIVVDFVAGGGGDTLVYGWGLHDNDSDTLVLAKRFTDGPVNMTDGQAIHLVIRFLMDD